MKVKKVKWSAHVAVPMPATKENLAPWAMKDFASALESVLRVARECEWDRINHMLISIEVKGEKFTTFKPKTAPSADEVNNE